MFQHVIDKRTQQELYDCLEPLELCDETGRVLARLTPDPDYRRETYEQVCAQITDEQIAAAKRATPGQGRTLSEIMTRLKAMNGAVHRDVDAGSRATTR